MNLWPCVDGAFPHQGSSPLEFRAEQSQKSGFSLVCPLVTSSFRPDTLRPGVGGAGPQGSGGPGLCLSLEPSGCVCVTDRHPGVWSHCGFFLTQNLFGKMADILEKIKK